MKNILIITDVDFWREGAGHRARIACLVKYLCTRVRLAVLFTGKKGEEETSLFFTKFDIELIPAGVIAKLQNLSYLDSVQLLLKDRHFDSVIIEYVHNTYYLKFVNDDALFILDTHDIITDRVISFKRFNQQDIPGGLISETEFKMFAIYDHLIAICKPDAERIKFTLPDASVLLCPHPVDDAFTPVFQEQVSAIGFIASEYAPNVDAIRFFIDHCWPEIVSTHNVCLNVYGNVCRFVPPDVHNINCKGFIENRSQAYHECDIMINPVRFGAGLKIKNMEAIAHGLPLLTTQHGARGLEEGLGTAFLCADGSKEWLTKLEEMIANSGLRRTLSSGAKQFAQRFTAEDCFAPLYQAINVG